MFIFNGKIKKNGELLPIEMQIKIKINPEISKLRLFSIRFQTLLKLSFKNMGIIYAPGIFFLQHNNNFFTTIFLQQFFYTNFLQQFFTPIFYTNFLHHFFTTKFLRSFLGKNGVKNSR